MGTEKSTPQLNCAAGMEEGTPARAAVTSPRRRFQLCYAGTCSPSPLVSALASGPQAEEGLGSAWWQSCSDGQIPSLCEPFCFVLFFEIGFYVDLAVLKLAL